MFDFPVVFVDIETTGRSWRNSRVLEVAAVRYENSQVVKEFNTLLNPNERIPGLIKSITGISDADVVDAPEFVDIADQLLDILNGAVFVAHNVRFDYSFLKQEFRMIGEQFNPKLLCTVRLSRRLYPNQRGHSLEKLIARHSIPVRDRHRALEDARALVYFTEKVYEEFGSEVFEEAIKHQLRTQYLPPHLDIEELNGIGDIPGVYIFRDDSNTPIYIGKSITLRKRILSHFQSTLPKEIRISQQVHRVETIPTGSELAALIMESKLIKELKPIHNRLLRRVSSYAMLIKTEDNGYATLAIKQGQIDEGSDLASIYGVFANRMKAKAKLDELTRTFQLCPKLMGLEKCRGACFSYSLGRCKGACIGEESTQSYSQRFEVALEVSKLSEWPYEGAIAVPVNEEGEQVLINNWIIQGFVDSEGHPVINETEPGFDLDEYKIIRRFIRENKHLINFDPNY